MFFFRSEFSSFPLLLSARKRFSRLNFYKTVFVGKCVADCKDDFLVFRNFHNFVTSLEYKQFVSALNLWTVQVDSKTVFSCFILETWYVLCCVCGIAEMQMVFTE